MMRWRHLDKEDAQLFKGFAILLIVLHNYFHMVLPSPGENEFSFVRARVWSAVEIVRDQPLEAIHVFFSFLGYYGVHIFLFLSAYGLTRSYGARSIHWLNFMWRRISRIYPAFLLAIAVHALLVIVNEPQALGWYLKAYALKLSLASNFISGWPLAVSGPWWFFSVIVQFYAIFPVLNGMAVRYGGKALLGVGIVGLAAKVFVNPLFLAYDLNLLYTVVGYLPELCLGVYVARASDLRVSPAMMLVAFTIFALGSWFELAWYGASVCGLILLLALWMKVLPVLKDCGRTRKLIEYFGLISLPLFAVHGVLRYGFVKAANEQADWLATLLVAGAFIMTSALVAHAMRYIEISARSRAAGIRNGWGRF